MPKYNFMISKAVDLVARKLAGMDPDTVARLTQTLSEEAQMISEELQQGGQNVNAEILAARLDGLVMRMKYELRNQGPDPSPNEFPIFNVSHNPTAPYPNPINHLYDKRYKEAYSTFIKQNQPEKPSTPHQPQQLAEPPLPTSALTPPATATTSNRNSYPSYPQVQFPQPNKQHEQSPPPPGFLPAFRQQQHNGGWQYMNPYATMPRSYAAHRQPVTRPIQSIPEQPPSEIQGTRRSSTGDDLRPHSLSRSNSDSELNYPLSASDHYGQKIRVHVIKDNDPSTTTPHMNTFPRGRSVLKSNTTDDEGILTTRKIYAAPDTLIGAQTVQDILAVSNKQTAAPSGSTATPLTERVIIIDRRDPQSQQQGDQQLGSQDRLRTFEVRSETAKPSVTPSTATGGPSTPSTPTPTTPLTNFTLQQQQANYLAGQQMLYQQQQRQPKMYMSMPNNLFWSPTTAYVAPNNGFYMFPYYRY